MEVYWVLGEVVVAVAPALICCNFITSVFCRIFIATRAPVDFESQTVLDQKTLCPDGVVKIVLPQVFWDREVWTLAFPHDCLSDMSTARFRKITYEYAGPRKQTPLPSRTHLLLLGSCGGSQPPQALPRPWQPQPSVTRVLDLL